MPDDSMVLRRELAGARNERDSYERLYLDEIERASSIDDDLAASQAEVERLREALNWYADQNNYKLRIDDDGRWYPSRVILDDGARARAAITRQKSMSRTTDGEMG